MGANNSTRRVSFESDENENISVVKGIRLSENVIKRMREPEAPPKKKPVPASPPPPPPTIPPSLLRPVPPLFDPITSLPPPSTPPLIEPVASPTPPPPPPSPPQSPAEQSTVEPESPAPVTEPTPVPESSPVAPPAATVDKEALRKKITDELHKDLEQQRAKAEQDLQAWLEAEKAQASIQAQAEARSQVENEVSRILSAERAVAEESLQQAIVRERIATEDEKIRTQLFAKQLEAREADLKKLDVYYREQVARLEERSAQFYKVSTENYHRAADEVNAKYRRYEVYPVCTDLQGKILACYKENAGKTLNCSKIAALYLECVNNTKQNKLKTGG